MAMGVKSKPARPALEVVSLPVAELMADPANARRHDERNLAAIKASLAKFGQQKPIVVGADGVVIAGNGTLAAAMVLGWPTIACVRSELAGSMAVGYAIADNRTAELAAWDDDALAETLKGLRLDGIDTLDVGFSPEDLDAILGRIEPPTPPEEFATYDEDIETQYRCPKCGYRWSGKPNDGEAPLSHPDHG